MRTFVFGIGGTGARVLRSLAMLLAAGCKGTSQSDVVVPVIIDYDLENGDTLNTMDVLECYQKIHRAAYTPEDENKAKNQFFCTEVQKLKEFDEASDLSEKARFQVYLSEEDSNKTYADHIGYRSLGDSKAGTEPTELLLQALYDTSDSDSPTAELNLNLSVGFKGCPNIGSVVTKSLTSSKELRKFMRMVSDKDRVVIVGSVFGGTGASGIPMLLDLLHSTNDKSGRIPIAVVAVTPYFHVEETDSSAINSDTFTAKTKSAFDAYSLGKSVNRQASYIYYVGDNLTLQPFKNNEGGKDQKNPAHIVELVGAMDIIHFMNEPHIDSMSLDIEAKAFEFVIPEIPKEKLKPGDDPQQLTFDRFTDNTRKNFIYPLAQLVLFSKFCKNYYLVCGEGENKDVALRTSGLVNQVDFKKDLDQFINYFYAWLRELQNFYPKNSKDPDPKEFEKRRIKRDVNLFNVLPNATYDDIFYGIETTEKGKIFGRNSLISEKEDFRAGLNKRWSDDVKNSGIKPARFLFDSMKTGDTAEKDSKGVFKVGITDEIMNKLLKR